MNVPTPHPLRTTPVPDEIWDVAAVVLGEQDTALDGWQRDEAIAAMTGLGDSVRHVAMSLKTTPAAVRKRCKALELKANDEDTRIDVWSVWMVAKGCRLPLTGTDRNAAITVLAALGLDAEEIAKRLCIAKPATASRAAGRIDVHPVAINASLIERINFRRNSPADEIAEKVLAA